LIVSRRDDLRIERDSIKVQISLAQDANRDTAILQFALELVERKLAECQASSIAGNGSAARTRSR
jgi:propanediol dehydratase small subunit